MNVLDQYRSSEQGKCYTNIIGIGSTNKIIATSDFRQANHSGAYTASQSTTNKMTQMRIARNEAKDLMDQQTSLTKTNQFQAKEARSSKSTLSKLVDTKKRTETLATAIDN